MVSFFIAFGFPIMVLKLNFLGGLVVRVEDFYAGTPGSNPPRHIGNFFLFKIQETCTLTTLVEQKPSLYVKKLRNFMRVYVNRERAV